MEVKPTNWKQERIKPKTEIDVHCKKCKWQGTFGYLICCDYILYNEEPRGCIRDLDCNKFEPKKGKKDDK